MVWGGISWDTRTDLVVIPPPPLNAQRYVDEILRLHVIPQCHNVGHQFLLIQDNARSHTARVTRHFLEQNDINTLPHPVMSPKSHRTCLGHVIQKSKETASAAKSL